MTGPVERAGQLRLAEAALLAAARAYLDLLEGPSPYPYRVELRRGRASHALDADPPVDLPLPPALAPVVTAEALARLEAARLTSPPPAPTPDEATDLGEVRTAVLGQIGPGECLTAADLADRTGYRLDSYFRGILTDMRRDGLLGGTRGAPGYSRGPKGQPVPPRESCG